MIAPASRAPQASTAAWTAVPTLKGQHMRMPDGSWRDTVVFSILDTEWPAVRTHLRHLMAQGAGRAGTGARDGADA